MLSVAPGFMYALKNRCRLQNNSLCLGEGPEQGRQKVSGAQYEALIKTLYFENFVDFASWKDI